MMLHAVWVLTRARLLIARNTFWRGKLSRKLWISILAVLLVAGMWGIYRLASLFIRRVVESANDPHAGKVMAQAVHQSPAGHLLPGFDLMALLELVPSAVLFGALLMLLLTSFASLLSSLYLSGDMDMLLAAPVPMRSVFIVKFFSGLFTTYFLLFVLLGPAAVGYGRGMHFGAAYYVAVPLVLALFPLLPASLGVVLVMAAVRVIPAHRAKEIVAAIGGLISIGWFVLSQMGPHVSSFVMLNMFRSVDLPLLPSAWAGRALVAAGRGEWLTLCGYGGVFAVLSIGTFAGCLLLTEQLYYVGWSNISTQGGQVGRKTRTEAREPETRSPGSLLRRLALMPLKVFPAPSRVICSKDFRLVLRDLRNLQQLLFPLVLAVFWAYQLITGESPSGRGTGPGHFLAGIGTAGISYFICMNLSGALGGPGISREGKGFWLLKAAPISSWQLLFGKFLVAYAPFPLFGTVFVVVLSILQHGTLLECVRSLAVVLILGLGTTSISVGMGAAYPRLDWENPHQQTTFRAGCLTPILYMLYVGVAVAAVAGPSLLMQSVLAELAPRLMLAVNVVGWSVFVAITTGVVWGALSFGAARLEEIEA